MADTTTVGTDGSFTAVGDLPSVYAVGTWGWWSEYTTPPVSGDEDNAMIFRMALKDRSLAWG